MAWKAGRDRSADTLVFGTNSTGLAKMYGYPKNAILLHRDQVGGRETYIFYAERKYLLAGVLDIVLAKAFRKTMGIRPSFDRDFSDKLLSPKEFSL